MLFCAQFFHWCTVAQLVLVINRYSSSVHFAVAQLIYNHYSILPTDLLRFLLSLAIITASSLPFAHYEFLVNGYLIACLFSDLRYLFPCCAVFFLFFFFSLFFSSVYRYLFPLCILWELVFGVFCVAFGLGPCLGAIAACLFSLAWYGPYCCLVNYILWFLYLYAATTMVNKTGCNLGSPCSLKLDAISGSRHAGKCQYVLDSLMAVAICLIGTRLLSNTLSVWTVLLVICGNAATLSVVMLVRCIELLFSGLPCLNRKNSF